MTTRINSTAPHSGLSAKRSSGEVVDRTLKYKVYDKNKIAVAVLDKKSGKIIREIPPEDLQKLSERIHERIGKLLDQIA